MIVTGLCCYIFPSRTFSTALKGNTRIESLESGNVIPLRGKAQGWEVSTSALELGPWEGTILT